MNSVTARLVASIGDENASCAPAPREWSSAMTKRRRFKQATSLKDRLIAWASEIREEAGKLAPGSDRDGLLRKASQADTASHVEDWAYSPGLQPPT
jgi:hypothetical protein